MPQRKYNAKMIWNGADHNIFTYVIKSTNRWASTAIKFTISPVVKSLLAPLEIFKA